MVVPAIRQYGWKNAVFLTLSNIDRARCQMNHNLCSDIDRGSEKAIAIITEPDQDHNRRQERELCCSDKFKDSIKLLSRFDYEQPNYPTILSARNS